MKKEYTNYTLQLLNKQARTRTTVCNNLSLDYLKGIVANMFKALGKERVVWLEGEDKYVSNTADNTGIFAIIYK